MKKKLRKAASEVLPPWLGAETSWNLLLSSFIWLGINLALSPRFTFLFIPIEEAVLLTLPPWGCSGFFLCRLKRRSANQREEDRPLLTTSVSAPGMSGEGCGRPPASSALSVPPLWWPVDPPLSRPDLGLWLTLMGQCFHWLTPLDTRVLPVS